MGIGELIVVLVVIVLVFGASRIPQLGDALGKGVRNFRKHTQDDAIDVTPRRDALPRGDAGDPARPKER
jgi:sec-independent protein translocase protein TatA